MWIRVVHGKMNMMIYSFCISGHFCSWASRTRWRRMKILGFSVQKLVWSCLARCAYVFVFQSMYWTTCCWLGVLIGWERFALPHRLNETARFIRKRAQFKFQHGSNPSWDIFTWCLCILFHFSMPFMYHAFMCFLFFPFIPKNHNSLMDDPNDLEFFALCSSSCLVFYEIFSRICARLEFNFA